MTVTMLSHILLPLLLLLSPPPARGEDKLASQMVWGEVEAEERAWQGRREEGETMPLAGVEVKGAPSPLEYLVTESVLDRKPRTMEELEDQCKLLLDKFSQSSSDFTRCANQYAKPIFMCRKCLLDFLDVRTYYRALEHSEMDGINCKELLTSHDKVEIVTATYEYIVGSKGLWSKGFCSSCYTAPLNHTSRLTRTTDEFFALADSVLDCFDCHPNATEAVVGEGSEACTSCRADYRALNKFYREKIFQPQFPFQDGICFDILDTMNSTQRRWGREHYGCVRKLKTSAPLLVGVLCVLLSPVLFYGGLWYWQEAAVERPVVQPHITDTIEEEDLRHEDHGRGQDLVDGWNGHEHGWE